MSESVIDDPTGDKPPMGRHRPSWLDPSWLQALKTPLVLALALGLAVQLLLALVAGSGSGMAPAATDGALLTFDADAVTGIEIQAGDTDQEVVLRRTGDGWTLPDRGDFPAGTSRVEQLIEGLAGLTRPLPVATSSTARKRFSVADDAFERRVTLRGDDGDLATLFIGDSPGFRRLLVRVDGEDAVYDVRLALFDLPAGTDDWIDRGRLQLARTDIVRIAGVDWTLIKGESGWRLDQSDEVPDSAAVDDLLSSLSSLGYRGVLGTDDKPEYGLTTPLSTIDIGLEDGTGRSYRIGRIEGSEDYALKEASDPYYYRLAPFDVDGLLDLSVAALLGQEEPGSQPEPESDQASGQEPDRDRKSPAARNPALDKDAATGTRPQDAPTAPTAAVRPAPNREPHTPAPTAEPPAATLTDKPDAE